MSRFCQTLKGRAAIGESRCSRSRSSVSRAGPVPVSPQRLTAGMHTLYRVATFSYSYELRRGEELLATGHLSRDSLLEIGQRINVNGREGIIRSIEPQLHQSEQRVVIQLFGNDALDAPLT